MVFKHIGTSISLQCNNNSRLDWRSEQAYRASRSQVPTSSRICLEFKLHEVFEYPFKRTICRKLSKYSFVSFVVGQLASTNLAFLSRLRWSCRPYCNLGFRTSSGSGSMINKITALAMSLIKQEKGSRRGFPLGVYWTVLYSVGHSTYGRMMEIFLFPCPKVDQRIAPMT